MTDKEINDARIQQVRKANELIQKSHFNLTAQQQKIIIYLISKISPYDKEFKEYTFEIKDFCKVCGIDDTNGGNYTDLKEQIKKIADKSSWIEFNDDEETLVRWIEKPKIKKNSGIVKIRLDEDLKPYLLQLRANYTQYDLIYTLSFKSKYSIRLYELIKSIHYDELSDYERTYELEELKKLLGAENYTKFSHFKDRALETAVLEINSYSDKFIRYKTIRQGRSIAKIIFYIHTKPAAERANIAAKIERKLSNNQLSLFDDLEPTE
jgi:plasmid replication initiation protein